MKRFAWICFIVICATASFVDSARPALVKCVRDYKKLGCFQEKHTNMDILVNDRDHTSPGYVGYWLDWKEFPESIHSLACRCSKKAKKLGYVYISIRFWAECYGGKNQTELNMLLADKTKKSTHCANYDFKTCDMKHENECAGKEFTEFFYSIPNKVNGNWGSWSAHTCSVTCGKGVQNRARHCNNPSPSSGGLSCQLSDGSGMRSLKETKTRSCHSGSCPVNGKWSSWSVHMCSVTCGNGVQEKVRHCNNPRPMFDGLLCQLSNGSGKSLKETKTQPCNSGPCPVNGKWSTWTVHLCSVTCGNGVQKKLRHCNNPSPKYHGLPCQLADGSGMRGLKETKTQSCNSGSCPV